MFSGDLAANSTRLLSIFDTTDVNAQLNIFNDVLQSTLDSHAPVKTIRVRNRPCPFVTRDIKQLMDNRNSLHRRFLQTRDALDWEKYKASRNTVKRVLTKQREVTPSKRYKKIRITHDPSGKLQMVQYHLNVKKDMSTLIPPKL